MQNSLFTQQSVLFALRLILTSDNRVSFLFFFSPRITHTRIKAFLFQRRSTVRGRSNIGDRWAALRLEHLPWAGDLDSSEGPWSGWASRSKKRPR